MPHDGHHPRDHNHNHGHVHGTGHLHSHPNGRAGDVAHSDRTQDFIDNFISGFRASDDKNGFLRMAHVPFELADDQGGPALKLVDVTIEDAYQVATASPAFSSDDLVYHPYPARMVRQRTDMRFVFVSLTRRRDLGLADVAKLIEAGGDGPS